MEKKSQLLRFKHVQHTSGTGQLEFYLPPGQEPTFKHSNLAQQQNLSQERGRNFECSLRLHQVLSPSLPDSFTLPWKGQSQKENLKALLLLKKQKSILHWGTEVLLKYNQRKYYSQ